MADPKAPEESSAADGARENDGSSAEAQAEEEAFNAEVRSVRRKMLLGMGGGGVASMLLCWGVCIGYPCFSTGLSYGMWMDQCPATDMRLSVTADASLIRGQKGSVNVLTTARFLRGKGAQARERGANLWRPLRKRSQLDAP